MKFEERTKGDEGSLQDRCCTPAGSSGHPTPNIVVLSGMGGLGGLTMPPRSHLNSFSYQCICTLQQRLLQQDSQHFLFSGEPGLIVRSQMGSGTH